MNLIKKFGKISGFDINWGNSALLFLDGKREKENEALPWHIKQVDFFKYVGIIIN